MIIETYGNDKGAMQSNKSKNPFYPSSHLFLRDNEGNLSNRYYLSECIDQQTLNDVVFRQTWTARSLMSVGDDTLLFFMHDVKHGWAVVKQKRDLPRAW